MTILVGISCSDGIVIGADSSATSSQGQLKTIEQPYPGKIQIVQNRVIVAGSGTVGLGQRFAQVVGEMIDEKAFARDKHPLDICREISRRALNNFSQTGMANIGKIPFGALVAFSNDPQPILVEFEYGTLQPEIKDELIWYVSMGSGQLIVDPFLGLMRRAFYPDSRPNRATGRFVTSWALEHAIDVNPGGINRPICLAELAPNRRGQYHALKIEDDAIAAHEEMVAAATKHLADFKIEARDVDDAPEVPRTS